MQGWCKNRISNNGWHQQQSSTSFLLPTFDAFLQFGKSMWVACKRLQPQLLWSCFESHRLLPSSHSCSNGQLMPSCPSCQHPCRCPPFPLHAGNEFPVLHVIAGAPASLGKALHWAANASAICCTEGHQPCQCHQGNIASDCSKLPEVDALSPDTNAPLLPGYIFNSAWGLATLYQNS